MANNVLDYRHMPARRQVAEIRAGMLRSARAADCPDAAKAWAAAAAGRIDDAKRHIDASLKHASSPQHHHLMQQLRRLLDDIQVMVDERLRRAWKCQAEARRAALLREIERYEAERIDTPASARG